MDHDVQAELQGYRNELAQAEQLGNTEHADAVRAEIARVTAVARRRAALHTEAAERHHNAGAHEMAAQERVRAARFSDAVGPGWDDAADHAELETAVTPKRARTRKET